MASSHSMRWHVGIFAAVLCELSTCSSTKNSVTLFLERVKNQIVFFPKIEPPMAELLAEPVPLITPASKAEGETVATLGPRVHGEDEVPAIKASPQPSVPSQTSIVSQPVRSTGYYGARVTLHMHEILLWVKTVASVRTTYRRRSFARVGSAAYF